MKRNISVFVLTLEIAVIVVLHAVKMGQAPVSGREFTKNQYIIKSKISTPVAKAYPALLSIK
ncbi:MAG: hypothetical protein ABIU63_13795 [Chitinophagaceae bacterium]